VRTGAAAFDPYIANTVEERMNCKVVIAGGSQETHSFGQTSVDDPLEKRLKTLGKPFPGNELKIIDDSGKEVSVGEVGLLYVRGAATSSGYYGNTDATLAAWGKFGKEGWFRTGDLAKFDEEGYLILVGREKEMILRGGQNIYPKEIEDLLSTHPKVRHAVVIGIPDSIMGEIACACVTLREGQEFSLEEMASFLREKKLAVHKLPEMLDVLDELPTLAEGQKIDKKRLANDIIETLKAEDKK
jgi:non-ribosomal peptide synthetase component E (peptide arylation enzyme)